MKTPLVAVIAGGVGCLLAGLIVAHREATRFTREMAQLQAVWDSERAELEAALKQAQAQARSGPTPAGIVPIPSAPARLSPAEILSRLQLLRAAGGGPGSSMRQAIYWLEELIQAGPPAVPVIHEFLAKHEDIEWDAGWVQSRAARDGKLPGDFLLPPSLRFGLFEALRRIGGVEAEKALAAALSASGRGLEVAYLTRLLHEIAPQQYRDLAVSTARTLLASNALPAGSGTFERNHRDHLFGVLAFYGDTSFVNEAQAQLIRADSQLDRSALRYLAQTLGAQAVPLAAHAYQNPLLQTNAAAKEPLARFALSFVGVDSQANEFYQRAITDPILTPGHRKNLIEDLNQDGFPDTRNLTANDLSLIQNRIALIDQLAPRSADPVNNAAFAEAYKDLVNMRARIMNQASPPPGPRLPGQP